MAATTVIPGLTVRAIAGGSEVSGLYTWDTWDTVTYKERLKDGADVLAQAFRDTGATR